jgi:hypothetical protein
VETPTAPIKDGEQTPKSIDYR